MDDDREREHPDEGTIHAWLDGALDDGAARALEAHVAGCRVCAERVAEARGLIAGASRIVSALDDTPSVGPAWGQAPVAAPRRGWRLPRVTPARAAIAATVLVALGVSLTYERAAVESQAARAVQERASAPSASPTPPAAAPMSAPMAAPMAAPMVPQRDPLLDSAVQRNIAAGHPPRAVEPAPGPSLPVPVAAPTTALADPAAPARVAAGRAAVRAERAVGTSAAPDQLADRSSGAARPAEDRAMATVNRVDSTAARATGVVVAAECYRIESANGVAATWGADALPLVVRVDSAGRGGVFTVAGQATGSRMVVTRAGDDSLLLRLRRIGYEGTLALGAPGDARAGVMRSRPAEMRLEQQVVTATGAEERPAARQRAAAKAAPPAPAAPAAKDARRAEVSAEELSAAAAAPAVPVVARRVGCPG